VIAVDLAGNSSQPIEEDFQILDRRN